MPAQCLRTRRAGLSTLPVVVAVAVAVAVVAAAAAVPVSVTVSATAASFVLAAVRCCFSFSPVPPVRDQLQWSRTV